MLSLVARVVFSRARIMLGYRVTSTETIRVIHQRARYQTQLLDLLAGREFDFLVQLPSWCSSKASASRISLSDLGPIASNGRHHTSPYRTPEQIGRLHGSNNH
jgi:hypothetical protein